MNKEFVPYEVANELKQLGFDDKCIHHYKKNMEGGHSTIPTFEMNTPFGKNHNSFTSRVSAPTYSQAFRWFRTKFNCHHTINLNKKYVGIAYSSVVNFSVDEFNTYEEAELACLKKLIEIANGKQ
jgi:hypothetical protein